MAGTGASAVELPESSFLGLTGLFWGVKMHLHGVKERNAGLWNVNAADSRRRQRVWYRYT